MNKPQAVELQGRLIPLSSILHIEYYRDKNDELLQIAVHLVNGELLCIGKGDKGIVSPLEEILFNILGRYTRFNVDIVQPRISNKP